MLIFLSLFFLSSRLDSDKLIVERPDQRDENVKLVCWYFIAIGIRGDRREPDARQPAVITVVAVIAQGVPRPPIRPGPIRYGAAFLIIVVVIIFFYEMCGVTFLRGEVG